MKRLVLLLFACASGLMGQTAASPIPVANQQFLDCRNGTCLPLNGGKLFSYVAGTTTPKVTYVDSAGVTANTNPVILNSSGFNAAGSGNAGVWIRGACYKFILKDSTNVVLWTQDNVCNQSSLQVAALIATLASAGGAATIGYQYPNGTVRTVQSRLTDSVSVKDFGAVGDGVADDTAAIQSAITATATTHSCLIFDGGTYNITGTLTSAALGQLCFKGTYNAVPYTGNLSGTPPRSASLVQQMNGVTTLSLTGLSNVVDGMDFTIISGATGVTAIYGTDTVSQPFAHNQITNNTIHGYSSGVTAGTLLGVGLDIESIGANSNNNTFTGNVVELAVSAYILHGASGSAVVNANRFHNWANNNTHAATLTNMGEMGEFWLSMEGNGDAVTAVGVCCSSFQLDNGEQVPPHLILSGGSHDNTLWGSTRGQNSGHINMTVTADSMVNNLIDLGSIWNGITSTGQRFWCFACVGESANYTPNLAQVQYVNDSTGTRPVFRLGNATNPNALSLMSWNPNGADSLGYPSGYMYLAIDSPGQPVTSTVQYNNTGEGTSPTVMDGMAVGASVPLHYVARRKAYYMNTGASGVSRMSFQLLFDNTANNFKDILTINGQGGFSVDGTQTRPSCDATLNNAGLTIYATGHTAGVKDTVAVCAADAANVYAWRTIY